MEHSNVQNQSYFANAIFLTSMTFILNPTDKLKYIYLDFCLSLGYKTNTYEYHPLGTFITVRDLKKWLIYSENSKAGK